MIILFGSTGYIGSEFKRQLEELKLPFFCWPNTSKTTFADLENDQKKLATTAWQNRKPIDQGGLLKFVFGKEYHAFNPDVINSLHKAVRSGHYQDFKEYADI